MLTYALHSVTELNIGILCACVPVFFVVLRTWFQKTESGFVYLRQRLTSRSSGKEDDAHANSDDYGSQNQSGVKLEIPSGTLSGLKSIFRKVGRTQNRTSGGTDILMVSQFELHSIDDEYHAHIRRSTPTGSTKSLIIGNHHV